MATVVLPLSVSRTKLLPKPMTRVRKRKKAKAAENVPADVARNRKKIARALLRRKLLAMKRLKQAPPKVTTTKPKIRTRKSGHGAVVAAGKNVRIRNPVKFSKQANLAMAM